MSSSFPPRRSSASSMSKSNNSGGISIAALPSKSDTAIVSASTNLLKLRPAEPPLMLAVRAACSHGSLGSMAASHVRALCEPSTEPFGMADAAACAAAWVQRAPAPVALESPAALEPRVPSPSIRSESEVAGLAPVAERSARASNRSCFWSTSSSTLGGEGEGG